MSAVLGDLILEAIDAVRDVALERDRYTSGDGSQADLDAAYEREKQTQVAVWRRLLEVAPQEYGGGVAAVAAEATR